MERRVDVMRVVAILGFVIALGLAVFAFTQQQAAQEAAQTAQTQAAEAQTERDAAVALAQAAQGTQVQAEDGRTTAVAQAQNAGTAQAEAESGQATAAAQAEIAGTQAAEVAATSTVALEAVQAALQAELDVRATAQAQSEAALETAEAELNAQATIQTDTLNQLSTATAQIDLAAFARESAEEDRLAALEQAWAAATALANSQAALETAQAVISGVTATVPPIPPPTTPTFPPAPTTVAEEPQGIPPLTAEYTSNNDRVTFNYPQGWEVAELDNGIILIGDSADTLRRQNVTLNRGQFEVTLLVNPITDIQGIEPGSTPADVMEALLGFFADQNPPPEFGTVRGLEIGGFESARVLGLDSGNQLSMTAVDLGNDIGAVVVAYSAQGEMELFIDVVDGIIASLQYNGAT